MSVCCFAASLWLIVILGVSGSAVSQTTAVPLATAPEAAVIIRAESILRAKDLLADVAILRHAYETLHPALHRYNIAAQMDQALRALELEFQRDRTLADAYLAFSVFAAKVKCGSHLSQLFQSAERNQRCPVSGRPRPFLLPLA